MSTLTDAPAVRTVSLDKFLSALRDRPVIVVLVTDTDPPRPISPTILQFPDLQTDTLLSCAQLAKRFGVPAEPLRKRLERFQKESDEGWVEVENRRRNQPRYLYRVGAVRHLVSGLRAAA
jgi:hypothetical protein